jgi:hypothetical protein
MLTFFALAGGTALYSSATQSEPSPIPPELKDPGGPGGDPTLPPPHIPIPPELKPDDDTGGTPNDPHGHIPIPPEIKGPPTGPPPQNIVVINGQKLLSSGGSVVVYNVPVDRWLVLTDLEANWPGTARAALAERLGAQVTDLRTNFLNSSFHSFIGIAFQPGSAVLLRETSLAGPVEISFSFSGFLVKPDPQD